MTGMASSCILCNRDSDTTPILTFEYRAKTFHICSQHLPVLIHDPGQLAEVLPGADKLRPSDIHD